MVRASYVIASLFAITARTVNAQDAVCQAPARIDTRTAAAGARAAHARAQLSRRSFNNATTRRTTTRLAIRRMNVDAESLLLMVDPSTLATSLEHEQCWICADTDDEAQKDTRFMGAVQIASEPALNGAAPQSPAFNAGLSHSTKDGSFITGDLCPSRKPLDRDLLEKLETIGPRTPVALAISGLWLTRHGADFQWLREQARSGALEIAWVNHSYHHPYVPGRPIADNFLLRPGVDMQAEILDTERLLIANGETPSIFFRFPGLVSDAALMTGRTPRSSRRPRRRRLAGLCAAAAARRDPARPPERQRASGSAVVCEVARQGSVAAPLPADQRSAVTGQR